MIVQALQKVFRKPGYVFLALCVSIVVFVFATWLPNFRLLINVWGSPGVPFSDKLELPANLARSITTNFTPLSVSYTIAIAILFGVNIAMLLYFLRRRIDDVRRTGITTGLLGIVSGVLGMGCAACGSFLLTSALSLFGASWLLLYLPLAGGEFGILGVALLSVSLYLTAQKIQDPAVCSVESKK